MSEIMGMLSWVFLSAACGLAFASAAIWRIERYDRERDQRLLDALGIGEGDKR